MAFLQGPVLQRLERSLLTDGFVDRRFCRTFVITFALKASIIVFRVTIGLFYRYVYD